MRAYKKAISVLLVTLLLLCMSITAFAADGTTNITAKVPCTVSMQIDNHGKVTVDSTDYTGTGSFQKAVGAVVAYTFQPSALYAIDKVIYDGTDVTAQLSGKTYTAPALDGNKTLQVSFRFLGIGEDTTYTVTFHANGHGTAPAAQTVLEGNKASEPTAPTADGYTFGGWYKNAACTEKYNFSAAVTGDLDLYAKWTNSSGGGGGGGVSSCTLRFETNGGSSIPSLTRSYGSTVDLSGYKTAKDGYDFTGWYSEAALKNRISSIRLNGSKTVYAGWEKKDTTPVNPFVDVFEKDWFYDDVKFAYENDLMNGTGGSTFSPNVTTTRGMIVTVLYRLEGEPTVSGACPFDDVKPGSYYEDAITWAAKNDIVNGIGNNKFAPEDAITREQMAAILWRYAKYRGYDVSVGENTNILSYEDAFDISEYAYTPLQWACGEGLMGGMGDGTLAPQGNATRAQIAAILHRFMDKVAK